MKNSDYIYEELKEIAPVLAEAERVNTFSIPENYFSDLDIQILNKITKNSFDVLPASTLPLPGVPEGYFENLAVNILQKIKKAGKEDAGEELKELSPILLSAKNKNVFTVPKGYFEVFADNLLNTVKPQAKVVVIKKRSLLWNSAAAAMLTGFMAISALWISTNTIKKTSVSGTQTASLNINDALQYKSEQQINEGIINLSDADIINYLEATGSSADDEALASGIIEKDLPEEQDYLTDENTLQIFLQKSTSKNTQN